MTTDRRVAPFLDWQSRITTSTSGLSVAISEESLRRLKYFLSFIRRVNSHINGAVMTLKKTLEQCEQVEPEKGPATNTLDANGRPISADEEAQQRRHGGSCTVLAARLDYLRKEVVNTLGRRLSRSFTWLDSLLEPIEVPAHEYMTPIQP